MIRKIVLQKEEGGRTRTAILRGVKHVDSEANYLTIQEEIDQAIRDGHLFIREGVRNAPEIEIVSRNGKRLRRLLGQARNRSFGRRASRRGEIRQDKGLVYPSNTIVADTTYQEVVNLMDRNGVRISWARYRVLFATLGHKKSEGTPFWLKLAFLILGGKRIGHLVAKWFDEFLNEAEPYLLDYRNDLVYEVVKTIKGGRDLFLMYGAHHLPGLRRLFENDGWKVSECT